MQQLWGNGSRVAAVIFFFFPLGFRIKQWVRAWGRDDQEDQEGLTVYRESGKNVATGASQDARKNEGFLLLGQISP